MRQDTIGARVATIRRQRGMTLQQVGDRSGLPPSTVQRIEHDRTKDPGVWTLHAIAHALDVSLSTLWMGATRP